MGSDNEISGEVKCPSKTRVVNLGFLGTWSLTKLIESSIVAEVGSFFKGAERKSDLNKVYGA